MQSRLLLQSMKNREIRVFHLQIYQLICDPDVVVPKLVINLTLLGPAYLSISKDLNMLGLGWVRVPILFGNNFLWNDLPYSKGFMNFGCPEPSKILFDF